MDRELTRAPIRISLIGTYHEARGAVTVAALLSILERIQPGVVFAECPTERIAEWADGSIGTVESIAASRYAANRPIAIVPVDLRTPDASFFRDLKELIAIVERTSPAYRRLVDENAARTRAGGFYYLNGIDGARACDAIERELSETVEYIRDPRLRVIHARVRDMMEHRETAMLTNIRSYSANQSYTRGAFLVGAAHRNALIRKIRDSQAADGGIDWELAVTPSSDAPPCQSTAAPLHLNPTLRA